MFQIVPPILLFVEYNKIVDIFKSIDDILGYIEAIDVVNDEYEAVFDSVGNRINIIGDLKKNICWADLGSNDKEAGRKLILEYYNEDARYNSFTYEELVEDLVENYGYKH